MDLKVKWTKRADKDFDNILEYLSENWNQKSKEQFIGIVHFKIDLLTRFPNLGFSVFPSKNIRAILITRQIRMYYKFDNKVISILTFFDTRQDPDILEF